MQKKNQRKYKKTNKQIDALVKRLIKIYKQRIIKLSIILLSFYSLLKIIQNLGDNNEILNIIEIILIINYIILQSLSKLLLKSILLFYLLQKTIENKRNLNRGKNSRNDGETKSNDYKNNKNKTNCWGLLGGNGNLRYIINSTSEDISYFDIHPEDMEGRIIIQTLKNYIRSNKDIFIEETFRITDPVVFMSWMNQLTSKKLLAKTLGVADKKFIL